MIGKMLLRITPKNLVIHILIILIYIIVVLALVDLVWTIGKDVVSQPIVLLDIEELLDILGLFLLVLVAIELMDTITAYLNEHVIHAEVVIEAALIAVARKVILLDVKALPPATIAGLGFILLALAVGYWIVRQGHTNNSKLFGRTPKTTQD